jgi:hypothetical protein
MLVGVFLIVVTEESMWFIVLNMFVRRMEITWWGLCVESSILFVFYAMLKDHYSPLRRDMEGSGPSYAIRLRSVIKLHKLI